MDGKKILTASVFIIVGLGIYAAIYSFGFQLLAFILLPIHILLSILYVIRNYAKGYIVLMMLLILIALIRFILQMF
jgi:hypothetical protein